MTVKDIIEEYGLYSTECAKDMARAIKEKYDTDIAVGITGNTGNQDPMNPEGLTGKAYYCILFKNHYYEYCITADVNNMSRREIKQHYADTVYKSLYDLLILSKKE